MQAKERVKNGAVMPAKAGIQQITMDASFTAIGLRVFSVCHSREGGNLS
jgi:hypothetical protein